MVVKNVIWLSENQYKHTKYFIETFILTPRNIFLIQNNKSKSLSISLFQLNHCQDSGALASISLLYDSYL